MGQAAAEIVCIVQVIAPCPALEDAGQIYQEAQVGAVAALEQRHLP